MFPTIACNLDTNILLAALPLFEAEEVEAIEWSFDALFQFEQVPHWFWQLIEAFADEQRLIGHGVFFSLFSGRWQKEQEQWLKQLEIVSKRFQFQHITEHFGFMTGADFHSGAPLSLPLTPTTLAIGQDRLKRIQQACQCPVGLENLAFAYSLDEVKAQGNFLDQLLDPINGFIILDLHNLYCQLYNFGVTFEDIISLFPLERVREIHISGGSWEASDLSPQHQRVRRDTHDDAVPEIVFQLLEQTLPICPNVQYVVMEQIGEGLATEANRQQFQQDFLKMKSIIAAYSQIATSDPTHSFLPTPPLSIGTPQEDETLYAQQMVLSDILEKAADYKQAQQLLERSILSNTSWQVEHWAPHMLETALKIAQKWKRNDT
jgi:uncharacterized protein (UPF0276 family)